MATRIAAQNLTVGGSASGTAWAATPEQVSITFQATEVVASSVVRCLILDNANRVLKSTILNGSSTKKLTVEGLETNINVRMEQLQGSAQVTASDGTGGDITADEIATGAVGTAEILDGTIASADFAAGAVDTAALAAGALSANAAGRAKIADDFFTTAEFVAGAGGKFAAGCIDATAAANVFAAGAIATAALEPGCATLPKFDHTGIKVLSAAGVGAAGPITLTGAVVGDRLLMSFGAPTAGGALVATVAGTDFEAAITVVDQIQQINAGDLSGNTYVFVLIPAQA